MTEPNQEAASAPAADQGPTPQAPAPVLPDTAGEHEAQSAPPGMPGTPAPAAAPTPPAGAGSAAPTPQVPSMGRTVIVREPGKKDAPGIIAELSEDEEHEETITCNVFRGDHITHVASGLMQIDPANKTDTGWFWPPWV